MAYQRIGKDPATGTQADTEGRTYIDENADAVAQCRGIMKFYSVRMNVAGNVKIKVFRDDGTNYVFIGESPTFAALLGQNNDIPCFITVEKGDLIGIYIATQSYHADVSGVEAKFQAGDITSTTLKTAWSGTGTGRKIRIEGKVFVKVGIL